MSLKQRDLKIAGFKILSNVVHTQAPPRRVARVVPNLAKREHSRNLVPILIQALKEASLYKSYKSEVRPREIRAGLPKIKESKMLARENELGPYF